MRGTSKRKRHVGRTIFCTLFSFLLSVFLTIASILMAIRIGFFNKELIFEYLDKVDFYNEVQQEVYKQVSYEIVPTGLELDLIDETIPIEKIHRSEEHTSELQSRFDLVCRLL